MTSLEASGWAEACSISALAAGKPCRVQIGDFAIGLFQVEDQIFALEDRCSHRGAPLSEGKVVGETVTCPWHRARFSLSTGAPLGPPALLTVRSFPVQVVDGHVFVGGLSEGRAEPGDRRPAASPPR